MSAHPVGRRALGLLGATVLALAPVAVGAALAPVAHADPSADVATATSAQAPAVRVELESLGPTALVPGSQLVVRVRVVNSTTTALSGARLRLFVNSPVLGDRTQTAAWAAGEGVQGGDRFADVDGSEIPLGTVLQPGATAEATFTVDADQLRLGDQFGARGVTVDVIDGSLQRLDALRTFLVWVPQGTPPAATGLTVLAPVASGAPDVATGQVPESVVDPLVAPGGRLARVLDATSLGSSTSLVVDPSVLGPFAQDATATADPSSSSTGSATPSSSATDGGAAATTTPPAAPSTPASPDATSSTAGPTALAMGTADDTSDTTRDWLVALAARTASGPAVLPHGDTDVVAAGSLEGGQRLVRLALAESRSEVQTVDGSAPAQLVWAPGAGTSPVPMVLAAAAAGADSPTALPVAVLDASSVSGAVDQRGASLPLVSAAATAADGSTASAPAVLVDARDSALLASATDASDRAAQAGQGTTDGDAAQGPAAAAARLLADAAVTATSNAEGSAAGMVLALPRDWDPDLSASATVLGALSAAPWVRSTPLPDLLAAGPSAELAVSDTTDGSAGQPDDGGPLPADGLATAVTAVDAVETAGKLVADDDARRRLQDPVERSATAAASLGWRDRTDEWRSALEGLAQRSITLRSAVGVVEGATQTVIARQSGLRPTVRNDLPVDVLVTVGLQSSSYRLEPGQPQQVTIPAGSQQPVTLPVRAIASGDVSVRVALSASDGTPLGYTPLSVRLRPDWEGRGVGVAAAVAGLVLVGGIARTVVRVRRRPTTPVVRTAEEADTDGPPTRSTEEPARD